MRVHSNEKPNQCGRKDDMVPQNLFFWALSSLKLSHFNDMQWLNTFFGK